MRRVHRRSLYSRMILYGCILCIVPVLAIGLFSYLKSSKALQSLVNEGDIHILRQMNGNIEQELAAVDHALNQIMASATLQDAMFRPMTYYDFQTVNNLKKEMGFILSPNRKATDVVFVNTAYQWVINNSGLYSLQNHPNQRKFLELVQQPINSTWTVEKSEILGSPDLDPLRCEYTVSLVKKLPLGGSPKQGLAIAHIPVCGLASIMAQETGAREVMIVDSEYHIVVHPDPSRIGQSIVDTGFVEPDQLGELQSSVGQFDTKRNQERYTATYVRSAYNGWTYISFTETSYFTRESRAIGWFTLGVCLLIMAVSGGFVWFYSRRMYRPLRKIIKAITDKLPDLQAKRSDEFQFIGDHIEEMFQSNFTLKKELHRNSEQMRSLFLQKLFAGSLKKAELEEKLELHGLTGLVDSWSEITVLTLQIDSLEHSRFEMKDLDLLLFALQNIVEETIPAEQRLAPVIVDQTLATLVGLNESSLREHSDAIYKLTEAIQRNIRTYLELDISIGISLPFDHLMKAPRAYYEGMEALKQRLKLGQGVIVRYTEPGTGKHTLISPYPQQLAKELIDSIKLADEERALELLVQWMNDVFQKERTPQEYQVSLVRLLNDLLVTMQEAGVSLAQIQASGENSLYDELLQLYVRADVERWFKSRLAIPMLSIFRDRSESVYRNISEEIIALIHQHFDTDITLEECAAKLHYNAFYLSSVFKKETSMSFSEYLAMYRFQMAKKWLTETDMPIKDIARKIGYHNAQNFIRSFRKLEDMTPGQFRAKYGASDSGAGER